MDVSTKQYGSYALTGYFSDALYLTFFDLLWIFGLSVAVAVLMKIINRFILRQLYSEYGRNSVVIFTYLTAPGTVIHELSHALFCKIFEHDITGISLFNPEPDGTLGYVEHAYNAKSFYQSAGNFFIGMAPIMILGSIVYLLTIWLVPDIIPPMMQTHNIKHILLYIMQIYHNLLTPDNFSKTNFWIYIIAVFVISSHSTLSGADFKGALHGILALILIIFAGNILTLWLPAIQSYVFDFIIKYYGIYYASMLFGLSVYIGLMGLILVIKILV